MIKTAREIITMGGEEDGDFFIDENPVKIIYHYEAGPMGDEFLKELIIDNVIDPRTGKELTEQNSDVDFYNIKNYIEEHEAESEFGEREDGMAFGPRDTEAAVKNKKTKTSEVRPFVTINWIESSLVNDEYSSDEEMFDYFLNNGLDVNTVKLIMKQRDAALFDGIHFELNTDGMNFDHAKNGFAKEDKLSPINKLLVPDINHLPYQSLNKYFKKWLAETSGVGEDEWNETSILRKDKALDMFNEIEEEKREKYKEGLAGFKEHFDELDNQKKTTESSLKITRAKSSFVHVTPTDAKNGLSCVECGRKFKENDLAHHMHAPGTPSGLVTYCPACKHDRDKEKGAIPENKNMRPAYANLKIRRNVRQANLKVIAGLSLMEAIEKAKSMTKEEQEAYVNSMIRTRGWRLVTDLVKELFKRIQSLAKSAQYDGFKDVKNTPNTEKEKSPIAIALEGIRDGLTLLTFILIITAGDTDLSLHGDILVPLKILVASLGSAALAYIVNNFAKKVK